MMEAWKPIPGFGGKYEVSSLGRVRSFSRKAKGAVLAASINPRGYPSVGLTNLGVQKTCVIHRLVATAFVPNPDNLPHINHLNGVKSDNRAENLEWTTPSGNTSHWHEKAGIRTPIIGRHIKTGEEVRFPSKLAAEKAGFSAGSIWNAMQRSGTHHGYVWRIDE